jgi:hypothetical protein
MGAVQVATMLAARVPGTWSVNRNGRNMSMSPYGARLKDEG